MKISPIQKICCSVTDVFQVRPTLAKKLPHEEKLKINIRCPNISTTKSVFKSEFFSGLLSTTA